MLRTHPDGRPAGGLHTHRLRESHADSDGHSYSDSDIYSAAADNAYTKAAPHTAAQALIPGTRLVISL